MKISKLRDQLRTDWTELAGTGAYFVDFPGDAPAEYQADRPLDVGSCFKVIVAAACCRQIERGMLDWDERLRLDADVRIRDSKELGELPDGSELTVRAAAEAMLRSSDNTATELLQRRLGAAVLRQLVVDAGMAYTRAPDSLRRYAAYYDGHPDDANPPPLANPEPNISTARDLARLYKLALTGQLFATPSSVATFKELLHLEEATDGTQALWPPGVVSYRKSGFLVASPCYALGLAGALATDEAVVPLAFLLNFEEADETKVAATIKALQSVLKRELTAIAAWLADEANAA